MTTTPSITITISTGQGWPAIRSSVAAAEAAAESVGGEVIVADGSTRRAPAAGSLSPATRWITCPGATVFQLRHLAYRMATAPIVAITEDHCVVPSDWARRMLDAHAAHPDAAAIGGSVENGAVQQDLDWASFLVVQSTIAAPIASGPASRLAGAVNTSYKRDALTDLDEVDEMGALDTMVQGDLKRSGRSLIADDSIRVIHDQSLGRRGTILIHFHAGRTFAGFVRRRAGREAILRGLGVPFIPWIRFGRAVVIGRRKGYGPVVRRVWPAMLALFLIQGAGQVAGFLAGPGDSPHKVQ